MRRFLIKAYPPFLGAGIRVKTSKDFRHIRSELKLHWWNRNYVGVHFGGSIYMMTDPFYVVMLIEQLGSDYVVWLKEATVRFRKPGRGRIFAEFEIEPELVERVRREVDQSEPRDVPLSVAVRDQVGDVVAEVDQILYVARREGA